MIGLLQLAYRKLTMHTLHIESPTELTLAIFTAVVDPPQKSETTEFRKDVAKNSTLFLFGRVKFRDSV